jgi:hypothetical protein
MRFTTKVTGSRLSPGASGEFGSHAIRLRSSHHMQVMTVGIFTVASTTTVVPAKAGTQHKNQNETFILASETLTHEVRYQSHWIPAFAGMTVGIFTVASTTTVVPSVSRLSLGASGEFGSHAIRPRSRHHMQVMTAEILQSPQQLPSSQRKLGPSVFRCVPKKH